MGKKIATRKSNRQETSNSGTSNLSKIGGHKLESSQALQKRKRPKEENDQGSPDQQGAKEKIKKIRKEQKGLNQDKIEKMIKERFSKHEQVTISKAVDNERFREEVRYEMTRRALDFAVNYFKNNKNEVGDLKYPNAIASLYKYYKVAYDTGGGFGAEGHEQVSDSQIEEQLKADMSIAVSIANEFNMEPRTVYMFSIQRGQKLEESELANLRDPLVDAVRNIENKIGFNHPLDTVYHARKHRRELPPGSQNEKEPIRAYLTNLSSTLQKGKQIRWRFNEDGVANQLVLKDVITPDNGRPVTLEAVVYANLDTTAPQRADLKAYHVNVATYGEPKVWKPGIDPKKRVRNDN